MYLLIFVLLAMLILVLLIDRVKAGMSHNKTLIKLAVVRALARKQREWNELRDLVSEYYGHRVGDIGPILYEMQQDGIVEEFWGKKYVSEELHGASVIPRMYKLIK